MRAEDEDKDQDAICLGPEVVEVTPKKFEITLALNTAYSLDLKLRNINEHLVAFKVKTTAPKRYMVRPTQEYIKPGETKTCQIVFAKMKEFPDITKPKQLRDKFLVQSLALPDGPVADANVMWKEKESTHSAQSPQYYEHKIKCKLVVPAQERAAVASDRGAAHAAQIAQESNVAVFNQSTDDHNQGKLQSSFEGQAPATSSSIVSVSDRPPSARLSASTTATDAAARDTARPKKSAHIATDPPVAVPPWVPPADSKSKDDKTSFATTPTKSDSTPAAEEKRKAQDYDALIDFTVKLTSESERLKDETKRLHEKCRRVADSNEALKKELKETQKLLRDAEAKAAAAASILANQQSGSQAEGLSTPSAPGGLRQRRPVDDVDDPELLNDEAPRKRRLELWQVIMLCIVMFFVGYFFS